MPIYVYETIPEHPSEEPVRFEVRQSIKDDRLSQHPETGQPVKRVIVGGIPSLPSRSSSGIRSCCATSTEGCCG
ncbi:MAG: zinc ribbon domain-containing protein [Verrucomicrobiota bacterium]